MNLHINYVLVKLILSNLGEVKVLAPDSLKVSIDKRVKKHLKTQS